MARTYALSAEALSVLSAGRVQSDVSNLRSHYLLPPDRGLKSNDPLPRPLYEEVNKALTSFGGKWDRGAGAHIFDLAPGDLSDRLSTLLDTGQFTPPQSYGYYPTPPDVVLDILSFADLAPFLLVLEPSAGRGAIADQAALIVGRENVHCCELLEENRKHLNGYFILSSTPDLLHTSYDFLDLPSTPTYDRVLMNPPFNAQQVHIDHVLRAYRFLAPGGTLVAVQPTSIQWRQDTKPKQLRALIGDVDGIIAPLPDNSFKSVGTGIRTCLVVLYA